MAQSIMLFLKKRWCSIALPLIGLLAIAAVSAEDVLPVEAFAKLPAISDIDLSPDGKHLAVVANAAGQSVLFTQELATGKKNFIVRTDNEKYVFKWIRWANDERILASLWFPDRRYGVATGETRLVSVGLNDTKVKVLSARQPRWDDSHISQFQDRVISYLPDDPDNVLVSLDLDTVAFPGVYRLNVSSGKKGRVIRHRKPVRDWVADQQGNVRAGWGLEEKGTTASLWARRVDETKWLLVEEYDAVTRSKITPLGFGLDPNLLYVRDVHEGYQAIFTIDTASENFDRKLVASDPGYDMHGGLVHSPKTRDVVGVYHYRKRGGIYYFDESAENFQDLLNRALPDAKNFIGRFSDDEMKYIFYSSSSTSPGVHYVGDRTIGKTEPVGHQYPGLFNTTMAEYQYTEFEAHDGETLDGFLWLPPGSNGENLPLVILPRGGYSFSDRGGFDNFLHFLANRGYAVFRPQIRRGHQAGYSFVEGAWGDTAFKDMGGAARHLIAENIADPDRICIAGAGYSGYVALMSMVTTPELYRCGISFGAVTSLKDYRSTKRRFVGGKVVHAQLSQGGDSLQRLSPQSQADRIKAPVLLMHGERDRLAIISHGRRMNSALKKTGLPHEYIEFEDGTSSLDNEKHRLAFFTAVDDFLARHLPVER